MNGFLLINKPAGITSYDVIRQLKKYLPPKTKIGHSGTLDPFATGLLIIAIGKKYTRQLTQLLNLDKTYQAELTFGITTDSYDIDGKVTSKYEPDFNLDKEEIKACLNEFKGEIDQAPPIFSAKKINGTAAYKLARKGESVELKTNKVTVYEINLNDNLSEKTKINISVHCSKGTYIRSLANDIGKKMTVGAFLSNLNRLAIGNNTIENAQELNTINETNIEQFLLKKINS